jgi:hypothetical protein
MPYEWDGEKAAGNIQKHGVSFQEAQTVFDDPLYIDFYDPDLSEEGRLLIVGYTERNEAIRLISAREVTPQERRDYEETGNSW